jgi:hypothetical protein
MLGLAKLRHFTPNYTLSYAEQLNNLGCCASVGGDAIDKHTVQTYTILSLNITKNYYGNFCTKLIPAAILHSLVTVCLSGFGFRYYN